MGYRIGHVSDMHLNTAGNEAISKMIAEAGGDPLASFRLALEELSKEKLDLLLMTGDLCHEGTVEEYKLLRSLCDEYLPGVPVFATLGNHDMRREYREGFLGIENAPDTPYCDTMMLGDIRLIAVDSAWEKLLSGNIDDAQYDWLEKVLETPAPGGNILMTHHPFCPELESGGMPMSDRLRSILKNNNFIALFNGHVHRSCTGFAAGVLSITGQSLAFDIEIHQKTAVYTTRGGYNMCIIDDEGQFFIDSRIVSPKGAIFQKKNM
ncbi:MAG: metallophosphoesterase [Clostridia bacterium]|nr:metallophosphoesterase [Clostridia bacterium]MBQ3063155.1 metallophosphoesterase [Clostridia bacterium]MBQ9966307.1 metallophosphoesterase [Clostridia bacterium]